MHTLLSMYLKDNAWILLASMVMIASTAGSEVPNKACDGPREFKYKECTCLKFVIKPQLYYEPARDRCKQLGGDMVTIHDKAKQEFVQSQLQWISTYRGTWIGMKRSVGTNQLTWVDGAVMSRGYENWGPGEPNNVARIQDCVVMHRDDDWQWRDLSCILERYSYVCQFGLPCGEEVAREEEYTVLSTTDIVGIAVGCIAGIIKFFAIVSLLIKRYRSMISQRKSGDRPTITLHPVEMGDSHTDDDMWNEIEEEEQEEMIPPPEKRPLGGARGNNLDRTRKPPNSTPTYGAASTYGAALTSGAGSSGPSVALPQANITKQEAADQPSSYWEVMTKRASDGSIEDNVLEANKDTGPTKDSKSADKLHN